MRFPRLFVIGLVLTTSIATAERRPHLVLFLADDLSWADCSIYGATDIRMPNLQRVARDGMTCTHAFVASPSCAPSRAALLTALSPARNGAMHNHQLPHKEVKKWPAWFQDLGYEVAAIGKVAHYAQVREYGFDHISHFRYHEDDCIAAAIQWLEARESTRPLCLLVGTNWPHVPWPQETQYDPAAMKLPPTQVDTPETRQARARYAEAVSNADRDLGLIYDAARRKLGENMLFVFTADHGSQFPFGKWNCTDAGLRTPLVAVWPDRIRPGSRSDAMLSWIDLLPTFVAAAGGTPPVTGHQEGQLSGQSFLKVLLGEADQHRSLVFGTHSSDGTMNEYPMRSVRSRDWRYVRNLKPDAEHHTHVDKAAAGDGRLYWDSWVRKAAADPAAAAIVRRYHKRPAEELYDLRIDPWEQRNLATDTEHVGTLSQLRGELDRWMKDQGDEGLKSEEEAKARLMRK